MMMNKVDNPEGYEPDEKTDGMKPGDVVQTPDGPVVCVMMVEAADDLLDMSEP